MVRKATWVLMCMIFSLASSAKTVYEWDQERTRYELNEKELLLGEYILKQHTQFDYVLEDNQFLMYSTVHKIIRVNNTEAIQRNNRIYVSMQGVIELVDLKARSINKSGKVVNFDMSNLKELKDDESGQGYRIFAIEGVEQGSEIEYYYVLRKHANLYDRIFVQSDMPIRQSSFSLTCPKHLKFDFESYNGFPEVRENEGNEETNQYSAGTHEVPGLKRENFSPYDANRQRIEYKIAYNTAKSDARLFTWDEAAKTFYKVLTSLDKNGSKAVEKFVKTLGDDPAAKLENRIRNVERKIKTTVQVNAQTRDQSLDDIESIIKLKLASKEGITRLFIAVFDQLSISCQPVITCSRGLVKFDDSFDSWSYLDEYVLSFPGTGGFLAPYSFEYRYPLLPPDLTEQKGLFIAPYESGEVSSASGAVKLIPASDYTQNADDLDVSVNFNQDLSGNEVSMSRVFGGCNATFVAPYYQMVNDEDRAKLIEELVKQTAGDAVISEWDAGTNEEGNVDNFEMHVSFMTTHFIETAGPRILFKVGELIGPQVEMYRDDERMSGIENDFNRGYDRTIRVTIPESYKIRNPDDVKINVVYKEDDREPFLFISDYTLEDNEMVITIKEYYKEIFAPVSRYEDFRKVINAAADFNKVTLVLEKK